MRVDVDYDKCQSIGVCESLAPHVFEVRPDGMFVSTPDVASADEGDVRDAVAACPTFALRLVGAGGVIESTEAAS